MQDDAPSDHCPAERLAAAASEFADGALGLERAEALLAHYPRDPRLHFLKGSLLAGLGRYDEARGAMQAAVEMAPDYALARFQLGFLLLTSGEAGAAREVWAPLQRLEPEAPLRLFAAGLNLLIEDRFAEAVQALQHGIDRNPDLEPMNRDMRLIIAQVQALQTGASPPAAAAAEDKPEVSAAHLLLRRYTAPPTRH